MTYGLPPIVSTMVEIALNEDIGNGDITTRLTVPKDNITTGTVIAKQRMTVSGVEVFQLAMQKVDASTDIDILKEDGQNATHGDTLIKVSGRTASLLMAERVALNFLQRLSGIATLTHSFVEKIPKGAKTRVTDTRKTSPGMRFLERRAVVHGGGCNHRADLGGGILIKENHIVAAGSVGQAVSCCRQGGPHPLRVEIEVRNDSELNEAIAAGADAVLLDNMTPKEIKDALQTINGRAIAEVSGGINLDNIDAYAALGVDIVSIGGLTHSAPSADISFLLEGA